MQINLVSEPIEDKTSPSNGIKFYYPSIWIKTSKKAFDDKLLWKGDRAVDDPVLAEQIGWDHLATIITKIL